MYYVVFIVAEASASLRESVIQHDCRAFLAFKVQFFQARENYGVLIASRKFQSLKKVINRRKIRPMYRRPAIRDTEKRGMTA